MSKSERRLVEVVEAIRRADLPGLQTLLGSGNFDLNQTHEGELPLVEAVTAGVPFVQALLIAGADVNAHDEDGCTALIKAADKANLPVMKALLAAGADANLMQDKVTSPLGAAAQTRSHEHLAALRALVAAGADVNALSYSDKGVATRTVLMKACRSGNAEAVRELLAAGADVNALVLFGTALTTAAEHGHEQVIKELLAAGADATLRVPNEPQRLPKSAGKSALEMARMNKHVRAVALLEGAAKPQAKGSANVMEAWRRLEETLGTARPALLKTLLPGATGEDVMVLAAAVRQRLPREAEQFFRAHNGQRDIPRCAFIHVGGPLGSDFRLLSLKEVIREWRLWNELLAKGEFRKRKSLPDPGIVDDWYQPGWIPITEDGLGNSHCIDLSPAEGGTTGQIILMWHDQEARPLVAKSLTEWLDGLAASFEQ